MDKQEHLNKIKAKCLANLALAEQRTQEKWYNDVEEPWKIWDKTGHMVANLSPKQNYSYGMTSSCENAAFIAACAGPAEAGWRSTIAAIDDLVGDKGTSYKLEDAILAAWPEALL